jgi:NitT/TauT family transport system substrate-binding protein
MLSACSGKNDDKQYVVQNGENVYNESGDTGIITDSDADKGGRPDVSMPPEEARFTLKVGFVKNDAAATAMASLAGENADDAAFEKYNFVCADNYTQLSEMLKNGDVGIGIMPPLKAMEMYAADKSVQVLASISGNSYKLVGKGVSSLSDLSGKTVYISGDDKTSVCTMTTLLSYAGVTDCTLNTVSDNAALYAAVKSGSAEYAMMTEPYISMLKQNGAVVDEYDFSQDWVNAIGGVASSFSSDCVVATKEYLDSNKSVVAYMLADMNRSVEAVKDDGTTSATQAVEYGFADDAKSIEAAYTGMDLAFFDNYERQASYLINNMFTAFEDACPDVFGMEMPSAEFYYPTTKSE